MAHSDEESSGPGVVTGNLGSLREGAFLAPVLEHPYETHEWREAGWSLQLPLIDLERPGQDPHRDGGNPPPAIPNEKQSYGICSTAPA